MDQYSAMTAAADFLEKNPDAYNFRKIEVPWRGGTGCFYGWALFFAGAEPGTLLPDAARKLQWFTGDSCSCGYRQFARRMSAFDPHWNRYHHGLKALRQYVRMYCKPQVPTQSIPEMLEDFREGPLPVWVAMRDRELANAFLAREAYSRFRRGLAIPLVMPVKEHS